MSRRQALSMLSAVSRSTKFKLKIENSKLKIENRRSQPRSWTSLEFRVSSFELRVSNFEFRLSTSGFNLKYASRFQPRQKLPRPLAIEFRIARFDAEEEAVASGQRKARHVKDGMIRSRQSVERQHREDRRKSRAKNRHLKGNGDKRRPTVIGAAADVQRIPHHVGIILQQESSRAPDQAANERHDRDTRFVEADRVRQALNRERREGVEQGVSRLVRAARRRQQVLGIIKLGQKAVERVPSHKVSDK